MFGICFQKLYASFGVNARVKFNGAKHAFRREYRVFSLVQLMAQLYDVFFPVEFCLIVGYTVPNYAGKWMFFTKCDFI